MCFNEIHTSLLVYSTCVLYLCFTGDVFVVYIRHRDSQTLQEGQLHSPRLYSIYKHPVLSELEKKKRVLSIYDKFHPHQVKFLEDCIEEL